LAGAVRHHIWRRPRLRGNDVVLNATAEYTEKQTALAVFRKIFLALRRISRHPPVACAAVFPANRWSPAHFSLPSYVFRIK
jgi:hypothetical protein